MICLFTRDRNAWCFPAGSSSARGHSCRVLKDGEPNDDPETASNMNFKLAPLSGTRDARSSELRPRRTAPRASFLRERRGRKSRSIVTSSMSTLARQTAGSSTFMSPRYRDFRAPDTFRPRNASAGEDRAKDSSQEPTLGFSRLPADPIQTCFGRDRSLIILVYDEFAGVASIAGTNKREPVHRPIDPAAWSRATLLSKLQTMSGRSTINPVARYVD